MKVAIVCGAPSSEFMAPYNDQEVEIWVLGNRVERHLDKRVTRIFEIHDDLREHGDVGAYKDKLIALANKGYELVVGEKFHCDENGIWFNTSAFTVKKYPYKEVEALYGSLYLTSSPAYMIAYALLQGATEIQLYGVDLSISDHEYFWQRPCVEAWIGFAKGRGVKVIIPEVSHVGKSSYVEGRDWGKDTEVGVFSEASFATMALEHRKEMETIQDYRRQLALKAASHDGAMQVYENLAKTARAVASHIEVKSLTEATRLHSIGGNNG
jgi:hypothetical protein